MFNAPANVVRHSEQQTQKHVQRGADAVHRIGFAPTFPEVGFDLRAASFTKRCRHVPRV
jgi:hypothetical protein